MRHALAWIVLLISVGIDPAQAASWVLATSEPRVRAEASIGIDLISLEGEALPDAISLRVRGDPFGRVIRLQARGAAQGLRRSYSGIVPRLRGGPTELELFDRPSSVLLVLVEAAPDVVQTIAGRRVDDPAVEPPLSENDPMYLVFGARSGTTARFQLSFKYRLFDPHAGFGRDRPWLSGLYFGYTQNSLWDLSAESKPFRDTSYRPSVFWRWERTDAKTWIDALRVGYEHESNGRDGLRSRSVDTLFVRPEWRLPLGDGARLEFMPKFYGYLDKVDNPDIHRYRGYADWNLRYVDGRDLIIGATARVGVAGKGSVLVDLSRRTRDFSIGPIGGYLHLQYFTGYGEDILGYNEKRKSQLRLGVAIVP